MAQQMSDEEYKNFLMSGTRTIKVATASADGKPHVAPVWFVLDGDTIIFTTSENTVKGKHILRDGRVSLCADDEAPPFAFVLIQGTVAATRNDPDLLEWATRIARRYMGDAEAEAYGKRNAVDEELLVRVHPTKITAMSHVSNW